MILFRGFMGTILHTGDMRFSPTFFDNQILFPKEKRSLGLEEISIHIDELYLDNTFCDPVF